MFAVLPLSTYIPPFRFLSQGLDPAPETRVETLPRGSVPEVSVGSFCD